MIRPAPLDFIAAQVTTGEIVLRYPDPEARLAGVRLVTDLHKREEPPPLVRVDGTWEIRLPAPDADRLEYLLRIEHKGGTTELVPAPGEPVAEGPFGGRSVLELPRYRPPAWTRIRPCPGAVQPLALPSRTLRAAVNGLLWVPAETEPREPLPLLLVHDGPEYARYADLVHYLEVASARNRIPRLRAALLAPVDRDEHYSASARYARALHDDVLPGLATLAPTPPGRRHRAAMGASLGALALLHAHRLHPDALGALFLQSGSFFRRRADSVESGFPRFDRIVRFVASVFRAPSWGNRIPIALTCGLAEENLGSNRAMADALSAQGYQVTLAETRDGHNWTSWRDALDPSLTVLLSRAFA